MSQLSTDCKICVIDYINTRSDLKSLSLVSKDFGQLAIEKLYKRIDIRLWSTGNTVWMLEKLELAKKHLRYTRELVVEDEYISDETESIQYGLVGLPGLTDHNLYPNAAHKDPAARNSKLEQILDLIPPDALRTFRFLSQRPLTKSLHTRLALYQRNITNLQLCLYADPQIPNQLPRTFQPEGGLKRLDVNITEPSLFALLLDNIHTIGRNLQFLSLLDTGNFTRDTEVVERHAWKGPGRILPLRELRLTGLHLGGTYKALSNIIDFTGLLKLDLVQCERSFDFISAMLGAKPDTQFRLTHLALNDNEHYNKIEDPEDERNICLRSFFKACPDLSSLHVGFGLSPLPPALKEYLVSRGKELKLLSLYAEDEEITDISEEDFDLACMSCPNLEQLAASVSEEYFEAINMNFLNLKWFLDSIQRLQKLRTLHIRCQAIYSIGGLDRNSNTYDADFLAMQMQKFANLVFGELYTDKNFSLEVLIVGHLRPLLRDTNAKGIEDSSLREGSCYLPQFCYVRGIQHDLLGRTATTGVPVFRSVLRRTHDHTSILDVDSGVEAWEQWVGQAM